MMFYLKRFSGLKPSYNLVNIKKDDSDLADWIKDFEKN